MQYKKLHLQSAIIVAALTLSVTAGNVEEHKKICSPANTMAAEKALADAKSALKKAIATFKTPNIADVARQERWFGGLDSASSREIQKVYEDALAAATLSRFYCPVVNDVTFKWDSGDLAAVHPTAPGAIFLTPEFFECSVTGVDSQAGTLVHELTHIVGKGLKPHEIYGANGALSVAKTNAPVARRNSDNYQYYVEDLLFGIP